MFSAKPPPATFEFEAWRDSSREVIFNDIELSNTERHMLRQLAGPGELLHRVQRWMVDYANLLRQSLSLVDIDSDEGVQTAREIRNELKAVDWQRRMWERLLTPLPEPEEKGEEQ